MAVWCAGWDETGWLTFVLFGMRMGGCLMFWLDWDCVAVWSAGWNETVRLSGVLVGLRMCCCMVCCLG